MERNFEEHIVERAVLVGLNADCFKLHETATEETLEELNALLEKMTLLCSVQLGNLDCLILQCTKGGRQVLCSRCAAIPTEW